MCKVEHVYLRPCVIIELSVQVKGTEKRFTSFLICVYMNTHVHTVIRYCATIHTCIPQYLSTVTNDSETLLTFDVPGAPYAVAETNLIILEHVEMTKVFPLWLYKHTTATHTHTHTHTHTDKVMKQLRAK